MNAPHPSPVATRAGRSDAPPARLFGRYLVDEGAIEASDLRAALAVMAATNQTIGELAVARGLLSEAQAEHIAKLQRHVDAPWGEVASALERGGLTAFQVETLLWEQTTVNLRIGDALIEVGALSPTEVDDWRSRYEANQPVPGWAVPWWAGSGQTGVDEDVLGARLAVQSLPRVIGRLMRTPAQVDAPRGWHGPPPPDGHAASISIEGPEGVDLLLWATGSVATRFAERMGQPTADLCPGAAKALAEVLEVLAAYVVRHLADASHGDERPAATFGAPRFDDGPERGLAFPVTTGLGDAVLVIDRR